MAQYKLGTISITNGTNVVTGVSTQFLANVAVGNSFKVYGVNALYSVIAVDSDTQVRISPNYAGTTVAGAQYQISTSFTPNLNLAEIETGDSEFAFHLTHEVIRKLDAAIPDYTDALASKSPLAGPGSSQSFSVGALTATTLNGFATSQTPGANQIVVVKADGSTVFPGALTAQAGNFTGGVLVRSGAVAVKSIANASTTNTLIRGVGYNTGVTDYGNVSVRSTYSNANNSASMEFYVGSSGTNTAEAMRITPTGLVGVGTPAPQAKLEVMGNTTVSGWSVTQVLNGNYAAGAGGLPGLLFQSNGAIQALIRTPNGDGLAFHYGTGLAEAMRIDSRGNLGLGSAPSTWTSSYAGRVVEIAGGVFLQGYNGVANWLGLGSNFYFDGAYKRKNLGSATWYRQNNGEHMWSNAASGAADSTITYVEQMRLTANNRLVVGGGSENTSGASLQTADGITFPSTQVASADPNTLDDYEEGTFTPVLRDGVGGVIATAVTTAGKYTKIGRMVYFQISLINIGTTGLTGSNAAVVTGLPFTSGNSTNLSYSVNVWVSSVSSTTGAVMAMVIQNATHVALANGITTGSTSLLVSQIASGSGDFYINGSYEV